MAFLCSWLTSLPSLLWGREFFDLLFGTATQWSTNFINLFYDLALTETWLSLYGLFPIHSLSSGEGGYLSSSSPFPVNYVVIFCKNSSSFKVQFIWLRHLSFNPIQWTWHLWLIVCLSIPIPVIILGDSIFRVDIQNTHSSIPWHPHFQFSLINYYF